MQPCIILQAKFSTEVTVQLLEWHMRRKQHQGPELSLRLASAASNHLHRSQPLRLGEVVRCLQMFRSCSHLRLNDGTSIR